MPLFGISTIRHICTNISALKQLTAHNYEDFLQVCLLVSGQWLIILDTYTPCSQQCALPVLEGFIPNAVLDKAVLNLLFSLADWHALAKLRMHTDSTLELLWLATTTLRSQLHVFVKNVCPQFNTKELPCEQAARGRHWAKVAQARRNVNPGTERAKVKTLNLLTYKLYALGDYLISIIFFGTTDSYSMQPVCTHDLYESKFCSHILNGRVNSSTVMSSNSMPGWISRNLHTTLHDCNTTSRKYKRWIGRIESTTWTTPRRSRRARQVSGCLSQQMQPPPPTQHHSSILHLILIISSHSRKTLPQQHPCGLWAIVMTLQWRWARSQVLDSQ